MNEEMRELPPSSMFEAIKGLLADLPALFSDRVQLLALEMKRASRALAQIIALLVAAAIFAATAWAALWAGLIVLLLRTELSLGYVLLIVLAINLAAAIAALLGIRKLARCLGLPATVRRLTLPPAAIPPSTTEPSHESQPT
jgi:hypothetical protein